MAAAELLTDASRALDANANPLAGAKWFFYQSGTSTPQSVYTTSALNVAHSNPVVADAGGKFAPIYFNSSLQYRGVLKSADEVTTIYDIDHINAGVLATLGAVTGATMVGVAGGGTVQDVVDALELNFAEVATTTVPASQNYLRIADRGGAIFKRFNANPGFNAIIKTQDKAGAWFALDADSQELCAAHFGITREPWGTFAGPNEASKLQAWITHLADNYCPRGSDMTVEARFDGSLNFKPTTGQWKTTTLRGIMRLRGGTYVTDRYSIEIDETPNYFHWDGGIIHSALGEATFANRRNIGGIILGETSRGYFGILMSNNNVTNAVKIVKDATAAGGIDNANLLRIGRMGGYQNGCGYDTTTFGYSNTIGGITQYGADTSLDQRSRISLGSFVPSWLDDALDIAVGELGNGTGAGSTMRSDSVFVYIVDVGLRKLVYLESTAAWWVYPKVPNSAVGKTIYLIQGAQAAFEGSDSNVPEIGMIEGGTSGIGVSLGQSYGSCINQFHTDGIGIAIALGSYATGTSIEHVVQNAYVEAATYYDVANTSLNARLNVLGGLGGDSSTGKVRIANLIDPVEEATNNPVRSYSGLSGSKVRFSGKTYRDQGNVARYANSVTLRLGDELNRPVARASGSTLTITLEPTLQTLADCVNQLGARHLSILAMGTTGANYHVPNVTFSGITSWKYNGGAAGAALNVTGLTAPTRFDLWFDVEDSNIIVRQS